ncbi:outer membrane protein assembly factor BamB [Acinetobacter puyangensis]|uniref:Outer membrane protein assembly factor BamB n=1 Tax=Acinetobacter puyangensis TaxID=1096779 RepID=A0A240E4V0_9GAMM|nr:outer membrane protein assembly factor BamB [Acinetobacter puyangensis]SNX43229.1 Beta-barrel assembly machine subunit BamB [Acinetobacter puyangensis]
MKNIVKIPFALTLLSVALLGCSSKSGIKVEEPKPNPLPKIQVTQQLKPVFQTSVSSSPKHDPLRYQLDRFDGVYYSVDPDGKVAALNGKNKLWEVRPSKALTTGVSVAQGIAVVGNHQGQIFALDAKTGQTLWQQQLTGSILSPALIFQNRVVSISNDGTVFAHDVRSGQLIWTFDLPDASLRVRGYAAPTVIDQRTIAVASANGYVYALDVITGVPNWQRRVAVNDGRGDIQRLIDIDGQPVVIGDKMVTVSFQGQVTVVDLSSQQVLWSEKASSLNSPAVDNKAVYVANTDGSLVAYDLYSGNKLWQNDELAHRSLSNPVVLGNILVVGDYDGVLHLIDPATGKVNGREKTSGDVRTLRVEDNLLYVATTKGNFSVWQTP